MKRPGSRAVGQSGSRRWVFRVVQLLVLAAVGYYMVRRLAPELRDMRWSELADYSPSVPMLTLSLVLVVCMYIMHAFLWRHLSERLGGRRLSARDTIYIYFISGLGRYLPGKLWQVAGMAVLAQRAGLPAVIATAASIVAQLAFITSGLILLAILLPTEYGLAPILSALLLVAVGIVLLLLGNTKSGRELRHKLLQRLGQRIAEAGALLDRISGRQAAGWTLAYGFTWIVLGGAFALFVSAFGAAGEARVSYLMGTAAASYVIGYLVFTPAGIGGRELAMVVLLESVMRPEPALLIAAASRLWFTAGELLPLLAVPLLGRAPEVGA